MFEFAPGFDIFDLPESLAREVRFVDERCGKTWSDRYVLAYHLAWMGFGGVQASEDRAAVREVSRRSAELADDDIRQMLTMHWRMQVMGAWFALARGTDVFAEALHDAFGHCHGSLTSPVLVAGLTLHPTSRSASVLERHLGRAAKGKHGDTSIVGAALRRLADPQGRPSPPADRGDSLLDAMVRAVQRLRDVSRE